MELKSVIAKVPDHPKPGIMFLDITTLLDDPRAFKFTVDRISETWRGKIDAVAGLEARGFIFGAAIAHHLGVSFVPVRKKGKLPPETVSYTYTLEYGEDTIEIKRDAFKKSARVLVVDDLLATGGTAQAASVLVEGVGAKVAGCAFVIELTFLGGRKKLTGREVQSLVQYRAQEL